MAAAPSKSPTTPGSGLLIALGILALSGVYYYWGQNYGGHVGGAISTPKIFWLNYALTAFFILPCTFWRDRRLSPVLRRLFGIQFTNWVVRGLIELFLMYGIHAWRPPYGGWHGAVTIVVLMILQLRWRRELVAATSPADRTAKRFMVLMMLSGACEVYFAYMFDHLVNFDTAKTWFASGDPKFLFINRVTAVVDSIVYPSLAYIVWRYYRPKASSGELKTAEA